MSGRETQTTAHDVALDVIAALDMYSGLLGSEETTLDDAAPDYGDGPAPVSRPVSIVLTLSDGARYRGTFELMPDGPRPVGYSDPYGDGPEDSAPREPARHGPDIDGRPLGSHGADMAPIIRAAIEADRARETARKSAEGTGRHCGYCRAGLLSLEVWRRSPGRDCESWRAYLRGFADGERSAIGRDRARSARELMRAAGLRDGRA